MRIHFFESCVLDLHGFADNLGDFWCAIFLAFAPQAFVHITRAWLVRGARCVRHGRFLGQIQNNLRKAHRAQSASRARAQYMLAKTRALSALRDRDNATILRILQVPREQIPNYIRVPRLLFEDYTTIESHPPRRNRRVTEPSCRDR